MRLRALFWLKLAGLKGPAYRFYRSECERATHRVENDGHVGKVTVTQDNPLPKDGWLAVADFDGSKHYGHGPTRNDALDDFVIRHGVQLHSVEA